MPVFQLYCVIHHWDSIREDASQKICYKITKTNLKTNNNKRLTLRSHKAKTLEKSLFLTLWIRITNGWNTWGHLRGGVQNASFNPTWHKIFFGGLDMGGGCISPPPGKQPSGTFMSSNHLVTDQAHKNGQFYDLKRSKILFNCKRDSRMTQKFQIF